MLVDDDGGASYQTHMLNALQAAGFYARGLGCLPTRQAG